MKINNEVIDICRHFNLTGEAVDFKIFTDGHINSTYFVELDEEGERKKYMVQQINTNVFKNPENLMENIVSVTSYLREKIEETGGNPERETLTFIPCENGKYYYFDGKNCWRMYYFIDNSYTCNLIENSKVFESAGRSFGLLQKRLSNYSMDSLHDTIEDFHNTPKRFDALLEAINNDAAGRASACKNEIDFALKRKNDTGVVIKLFDDGLIPLRVTHNDTKLNNILFDNDTNESICVIDLDTIMPGFSLYDFGDAIRFGGNTTYEDDKNLDNVTLSLELYESYTKGYLSACAEALTHSEVENLAFSAKLMTYECGIRFLTDYLNGDTYFKTEYAEHNLVRAKNQFKLVSDIENKLDKMNEITEKIYKEALCESAKD